MLKKLSVLLLAFCLQLNTYAQEDQEALVKKINERGYPAWFTEAKLGIFVHWGLYSVPAIGKKEDYGEWFLRGLQLQEPFRTNFMKTHYGADFTYNDFASLFKAELFDPTKWADLFKQAGAKYVVLVSKHHDGYALWPSDYSRNWNSVDTGPKRDIVGELSTEVRKKGLKMGLYYSLAEWNHPLHRWYTDPNDSIGRYVDEYMIPQFKELVTTYRPSLIFSDGEWLNSAKQWHSAELIQWYYDLVGKEAIVNNRWGGGIDVGFLTPEYSAGIKVTDRPWTEVRGIGRSFGLNRNEDLAAYGTSSALIQRFVQTVANGGGMILNVGPNAAGQIPLIQQERLLQLGHWLKINGEAIYGAKPNIVQEEERMIRKSGTVAAIDFDWVRNSPLEGIKEDEFTAEYKGYLVPSSTGKFTLAINADDEAVVYLDDKLILNQNYTIEANEAEVMGAKTGMSKTTTMALKKGQGYALTIKYKEHKQNASLQFLWKQGKDSLHLISPEHFYQDQALKVPGLKVTYAAKKTYRCYTKNNGNLYAINFEWPDEELVITMPAPKAESQVHLLGLDRALPWTYKAGAMHINTGQIRYAELPSHDAWTFKISQQE